MAAKTVTAVNNAQLDTAQKKFGSASCLFDGTSDCLNLDASNSNATFDFGSGDWTMELFVRWASVTTTVFLSRYTGGDREFVWYYAGGNMQFAYSTTGSDSNDTGFAWTPSADTWYHVAVCRNGNNLRCFVDGTQIGSTLDVTGVTFYASGSNTHIAADMDPAVADLNGWMDELRIVKGSALYTANFTAPAAELSYNSSCTLLLHFNGTDASTTFTDDSETITSSLKDFIGSGLIPFAR